jgi:hypothetical protein
MRVVDTPDNEDNEYEGGSTVLARARGTDILDATARAALQAQSLAAESIDLAIGELRRQVASGLSEGLRLKAALELVRIATTPPQAAAPGRDGEQGFGGGGVQQTQQILVMDLKEAGRIARNADADE